jgi:hypothetical protein
MFDRTKVILTIAACMVSAIPVAAQAPTPTTTTFDGTYAGVSRTLETTMRGGATRSCPPSGKPAPLTISNGAAQTLWGGTAEGSVNSQGVLVIRAPNGARIDGQIDGHGSVTGRITSACSYQVIWQKKGL